MESWKNLRARGLEEVPTTPGNYVVYRPAVREPEFLEESPAGWFKQKDPSVSIERLGAKWVEGARILYVGKADMRRSGAGAALRRRLEECAQFGGGKAIGHSGGRLIWQLADASELLVAWRELGAEASTTASNVEDDLLSRFKELHDDRLPFANLRL